MIVTSRQEGSEMSSTIPQCGPLRIVVLAGGVSGFQYGFTFDEVKNEDDTVIEKYGVQLLIDPMSYQYLIDAEIDFSDGLNGAEFVVKNPNAKSTCGCGSSFST